jgi:polyhydroxyalkanoate synthesis repressor PhaR
MPTAPIQIRRYPNRRFYDRSQRRYVTLGDIEDLVRQGRTIEVQDSRTGDDLTRQILTQILLERHPDKMQMFPAALLHALLRANDLASEFWQTYLQQTLQVLENLQRSVVPLGTPLPWLSAFLSDLSPTTVRMDSAELIERLAALEERICRLEAAKAPSSVGGLGSAVGSTGSVDRLEQRVRGLESRNAG